MTKGNPTNTLSIDDREMIEEAWLILRARCGENHLGRILLTKNDLTCAFADRLEFLLSERDKLEERVRELERGLESCGMIVHEGGIMMPLNRTANNG